MPLERPVDYPEEEWAAIQRGCDAFLRQVKHSAGTKDQQTYRDIIHALINWSILHHGSIAIRPRQPAEKHFFVRFCLIDSTRVFWAAYPRDGDGAKLMALQDKVSEYPNNLRDRVRDEFKSIRGNAREPSKIIPTLSFAVLQVEPKLTEVIGCLERALADIKQANAG